MGIKTKTLSRARANERWRSGLRDQAMLKITSGGDQDQYIMPFWRYQVVEIRTKRLSRAGDNEWG